MIELILVANVIWFGLGFHLFALRNQVFAKLLVPREHRETPVFAMLAETGKFLGGFNFAFCLLSVIFLFSTATFGEDNQRAILFLVFAVAHGSQFLANVPVALENRKGGGVWQVKGLMGFIFVTDFILTVANLAVAALYLM